MESGVLCEVMQRPGNGNGGCVGPGEEEGGELVEEFGVGESLRRVFGEVCLDWNVPPFSIYLLN